MASRFILGAYWPSRRESVDQCRDRLASFLGELAPCDPVFEIWYERGRSQKAIDRRVNFEDRRYLLNLLERGRNRRDIGGEVIEELGFNVGLWNEADRDKATGLNIGCGIYWKSPTPNASLGNSVVLTLPRDMGELRRAENMVKVLSIVAEVWEPAWAGVMSRDAMNTRNFDPDRPFVDWMTYVSASVSEVPAPSSVRLLPGRGSIVVVQPTPPSEDEPHELTRIRQIDELLQKAA
jgi:hypothetical protein